jgi:hypothetical protein
LKNLTLMAEYFFHIYFTVFFPAWL